MADVPGLTITAHEAIPKADALVVDEGLGEANDRAAPYLAEVRALACFARDDAGRVLGGAVGRTWGRCAELQQLWVADSRRGEGLGTRLVERFHAEAEARGSRVFYLDTWNFQARPFYERLGYRVRLVLAGFRPGVEKYTMVRESAASLDGPLAIRPLGAADQDFLWDALHVALWDPPPAPLRPREVLDHPGVQIYAEGWGRETDIGVCGTLAAFDRPVGACWMRLVPERKGLGYVDDATPQLGIAVMPGHQGKGYGRLLMQAALAAAKAKGIAQVSLTVHEKNPARRLYEQCGFRLAGRPGPDYALMVAKLSG